MRESLKKSVNRRANRPLPGVQNPDYPAVASRRRHGDTFALRSPARRLNAAFTSSGVSATSASRTTMVTQLESRSEDFALVPLEKSHSYAWFMTLRSSAARLTRHLRTDQHLSLSPMLRYRPRARENTRTGTAFLGRSGRAPYPQGWHTNHQSSLSCSSRRSCGGSRRFGDVFSSESWWTVAQCSPSSRGLIVRSHP